MKPAIYLRVSTEIQSLESQRMEVLRYCEFRKWPTPAEYCDVISGSKASRDGLDRLIADMDSGKIDMIVVVKLDRLGRSLKHITGLIAKFEKQGVALVCTSQGIDTTNSNPMGRMQLGILAVFAEFEREMIRERTRAGLKVARANGKVLGRPNLNLVPESERAGVVHLWRMRGRPGGLRGLGKMLGGVSATWAMKIEHGVPEVAEV